MKKSTNTEFSKVLLIQESVLIWIMTLTFLVLAFVSVFKGYLGSLPWLTAMVSLPWTAYGVSQACYYKKATVENSKDGIKFESVMAELNGSETEEPLIQLDIDANQSDIDIDYGI